MGYQQITTGVYQVTRGGVNAFILETRPDELTIIDTGFPGTTNTILSAVAGMGKMPQHIQHILITHADIDHVGSLGGLVAATGATVYSSELSKPHIEKRTTPPHIPAAFRLLAAPVQKLLQKAASVDTTLRDGQLLDITDGGIEVIAIAGHTPDNYGYYWRKMGILFAPDLLNTQGGTLGLTPPAITWDMAQARESARKVLELAPKIICVGHGNAVNLVQSPDAVLKLERALHPNSAAVAL